jgi:hypothetical protein
MEKFKRMDDSIWLNKVRIEYIKKEIRYFGIDI